MKDIDITVDPNELIEFSMFFFEDKDGDIKIQDSNNGLTDYVEHKVWFRKPNYEDSVRILSHVFRTSEKDINPIEIGLVRSIRIIKKWTFKDKDGSDLPCTPERISGLQSYIGEFISSSITKILEDNS